MRDLSATPAGWAPAAATRAGRAASPKSLAATLRARLIVPWLTLLCLLVATGAALADDRVALVVGNNNYSAATKLDNAINDAQAIRDRLEGLRFKVVYREDATRGQFFEALKEFQSRLRGAEAAVVFFAGHGIQYSGQNYLLPVDAAMTDASDADAAAIGLGSILQRLVAGGATHNFLFLDACRNNPFPNKFNAPTGLASVDALPNNTRLVFATEAGKAAYDAVKAGSRHGAFTFSILKWIGEPNLEAAQMLQNIQIGVQEDTAATPQGQQKPYINSNVGRRFFFRPGDATAVASAPTAAGFEAKDTVEKTAEIELWKTVGATGYSPDMLRLYLKDYPQGRYAAAARQLLRKAEGDLSSPAVPSHTTIAAAPPENTLATRTAPNGTLAPATGASPATPAQMPTQIALAATTTQQQPTAPKLPVVREEMMEKYTAPEGWTFTGMVKVVDKDRIFHGKGDFQSKAFRYVGEFKDGKKHGDGEMTWADGSRYKGKFVDDELSDKEAFYRLADGSEYTGEVRGGKITGQGKMRFKDGGIFEGGFLDGRPNGTGVFRFPDGATYEGEMTLGKQNGKNARFTKANGDRYIGDFVDGVPNGKGKWVFAANGHEYDGDIRAGRMTGEGTYRYGASGMSYRGQVVDAAPNGKGVLYFADGNRFEGEFKDGTANAKGVLVEKDGKRRPAEIVNGEYRFN